MKDLVTHIKESLEFPMQGMLRKGDKVQILWYDKHPNDGGKVVDKEDATVEKVVSKDLGQYSGDQHTWAYVNGIRFELKKAYEDQGWVGFIDYKYKKNPKDKHAAIALVK